MRGMFAKCGIHFTVQNYEESLSTASTYNGNINKINSTTLDYQGYEPKRESIKYKLNIAFQNEKVA